MIHYTFLHKIIIKHKYARVTFWRRGFHSMPFFSHHPHHVTMPLNTSTPTVLSHEDRPENAVAIIMLFATTMEALCNNTTCDNRSRKNLI